MSGDSNDKPRRWYAPEEKGALTSGRISGRSTLAQQDFLLKLGVPRQRSVVMTKYKAKKEIEKRLAKRQPSKPRPCVRCELPWFEWDPIGLVIHHTPYGPLCQTCTDDLNSPDPKYPAKRIEGSLGEITEPIRRAEPTVVSASPQECQDPQFS